MTVTMLAVVAVLDPARAAAEEGREDSFVAGRAQKVQFRGQAWLGWAGDVTEKYQFPNQFFINRINLRFEGNFDAEGKYGFRIRLETGGIGLNMAPASANDPVPTADVPSTGGGWLFMKWAYLQIYKFLLSDDKLQIGATALPWIPYEEDIFGYRVLRATGPELWGYQTPSDIGLTHYLFLSDQQVTVQWGIWNGDYTAKGVDAFGNGQNITDYFKMAGIQAIFRHPDGISATVAFLLQNQSGDDRYVQVFEDGVLKEITLDKSVTNGVGTRIVEDGFRVYAGVYYKRQKEITLGLSGGIVAQRGIQDALSAFATVFAVVNLGVIAPELDYIELVMRFDVHQLDFNDPTRGEAGDLKFLRPDGSVRFWAIDLQNNTPEENARFLGGWEFAVTVGLALRLHALVTVIAPAFRGDYSDARRDTSVIGAFVDIRF